MIYLKYLMYDLLRPFGFIFVTILSSVMLFSTPAFSMQCADLLTTKSILIHNTKHMERVFKRISSQEDAGAFIESAYEYIDALDETDPKNKFVSKTLKKELMTKITPYIKGFSSMRVIRTLIILVKLQNTHLNARIVEELEANGIRNIESQSAFELTKFLDLFKKLKVAPSKSFLRKWEDQMASKMKSFSPSNLTSVISSYGSLGITPGALFLRRWSEVMETKISSFKPRQTANTLYGFYLMNDKVRLEGFINKVSVRQFSDLLKEPEHIRQASMVHLYMEKIWGVEHEKLSLFAGLFKKNVRKPSKPSELEKKWLKF